MAKIPNLGPKSMAWLERVGVTSVEQLRQMGAERVYQLVIEAGHEPNRNLLYGLKGAEMGLDWRIVAEQERRARD